MSALKAIVETHVVRPGHAGSGSRGFDRTILQQELMSLKRSREIGFWLMFLLLALLFIAAGVAVVYYRSDLPKLGQLSAITGVTFLGVVASMVRLWSQKVKTDLLLAIVMSMPEKAVQGVLNTLLGEL